MGDEDAGAEAPAGDATCQKGKQKKGGCFGCRGSTKSASDKSDRKPKGFFSKVRTMVEDMKRPQNRMQEISQEPFAIKGWTGSVGKQNEYMMYIVPHESNRYLCFDKPKTFQSWQKYTTAGMIAFNNEEQNGTKAGLERCRKNAAKVVKNKVKWEQRKKMEKRAKQAASFVEDKAKETLQPMDYGNCKGALQQLAFLKASTMKTETDTEDEDEDGAEEGQQSRN